MGKMSGDKYPEDKRLVFDTITEQFDEWRERYCEELFEYIRTTCELKAGKKCLEIGPGTGQASDFAIQSGCDYTAIELGGNLAEAMQKKYKNGESYGFSYLGEYKFYGERSYTAQGFVEYIKTNADLITIKDSSRDAFFSGIQDAIMRHGNKIVVRATYVLDLYQKICDN